MAESIRDIIRAKSEALRFVDQLGPAKASEELVSLSSLLASLNAYIGEKQYWYNMKNQALLLEFGTAAKAKIHAQASQEWKEWNDAVLQKEALEELIRSVKYYLRSAENEQKLSGF